MTGGARPDLRVEQFTAERAGDVASIFCQATRTHPYCALLTADMVLDRLVRRSFFDPRALLIAYRNGRPVGYAHGAFGKPRGGEDAPDTAVGNVRGLFFPPDDVEAGRVLLDQLLAYLIGGGARDLQAWGSFAGYPFYRGLYLGTEPVAAASHAHAIVRLHQAGFRVNQHSIFLTRPMDAPPPAAQADPPVELAEAPLTPATAWVSQTWLGLEPRLTTAWRSGEQVGQITWALLPDLIPKRGHLVGSIAGLRIEERYRRQGIARTLVLAAMRRSYAAGAREMTVATTQENTAALHTYYACGYTEVEILLGHARPADAS